VTFTFTIAGSAKTVQVGSLSIDPVANGRDVLSARIYSANGSYIPAVGAEVIADLDGTRLFGGHIKSTRIVGKNNAPITEIETEISCQSFKALAEDQFVTETVADGTTMKAFLQTLETNYFTDLGITLDAAQVTGPNLTEMSFSDMALSAVFDEVTKQTGFVWNIDEFKVMSMFEPAVTTAPFNIAVSDKRIDEDLVVESTRKDYCNRVIVRAGEAGLRDLVDSFTGDGSTDTFQLRLPIAGPTTPTPDEMGAVGYAVVDYDYVVNPGGTESLAGAAAPSGFLWEYNATTFEVTRRSGAPPNTTPIQVRYKALFPISVQADDLVAQAADGRVITRVFVEPNIYDPDQAQARAEYLLSLFGGTLQTVEFSTRRAGLRPGMTLTINVPARSVNGTFLVQTVNITNDAGNNALRHHVTAIGGTTVRPSYWHHVIQSWLGDGSVAASTPEAGPGGAAPYPPEGAIQSYKAGTFYGSAQARLDPDGALGTLGYSALPALMRLEVPDDDKYALAIGRSDRTAADRLLTIYPYGPDGQIQADVVGKVEWFIRRHAGLGTSGNFQLLAERNLLLQADQAYGIVNCDGFTGAAGLGLFRKNLTNSDSPYTISATERSTFFSCDATSGNVLLNAPAIAGNWTFAGLNNSFSRLVVIKHTGSANTVTWDPNSTETADGNSTVVLTPGEAVMLLAGGSGTQWRVVGRLASGGGIRAVTVTLTDAQIKALPSAPITLVPALGTGIWAKPIALTLFANVTNATYTNINTTYSALSLSITDAVGSWIAVPVVNDNTTTPAMDRVTGFLGGSVHDSMMAMPVPYMDINGDQWLPNVQTIVSGGSVADLPVVLAMDNNGSGNLTGGHASNTLRVILYYAVEALA
jgi:hypothetical protein